MAVEKIQHIYDGENSLVASVARGHEPFDQSDYIAISRDDNVIICARADVPALMRAILWALNT
jgi:hypothetical protein